MNGIIGLVVLSLAINAGMWVGNATVPVLGWIAGIAAFFVMTVVCYVIAGIRTAMRGGPHI